jgi:hypothetical protein
MRLILGTYCTVEQKFDGTLQVHNTLIIAQVYLISKSRWATPDHSGHQQIYRASASERLSVTIQWTRFGLESGVGGKMKDVTCLGLDRQDYDGRARRLPVGEGDPAQAVGGISGNVW